MYYVYFTKSCDLLWLIHLHHPLLPPSLSPHTIFYILPTTSFDLVGTFPKEEGGGHTHVHVLYGVMWLALTTPLPYSSLSLSLSPHHSISLLLVLISWEHFPKRREGSHTYECILYGVMWLALTRSIVCGYTTFPALALSQDTGTMDNWYKEKPIMCVYMHRPIDVYTRHLYAKMLAYAIIFCTTGIRGGGGIYST